MIDLHMHSKYSEDGEYTPFELVEQCVKKGIDMMSIVDHNCVKANTEAETFARERGITYIPGIEIDCVYKDTNFHVLGYGIDFESKEFVEIEKNIRDQSLWASLERLVETQKLGFDVTEDDMWAISKDSYWPESWTGELFAEVLLSKIEYKDHPILRPYRVGGSRNDNPQVNFYWDYYSQGKPCYAEIQYPKMQEIIDIIHNNHGIAVLAHPGVNLKGKEYLLKGILEMGIDGIEVFSSYHSPEQISHYYKEVKKHHLLFTCGSDYHGKIKPSIILGEHGCQISDYEIKMQLEKKNF
ncbi:MAG: PHP domain-containing protein [Lachnospiraceae bacterium]|nr:PHP domain-containing protein [Lachnospiraceae bacterium]